MYIYIYIYIYISISIYIYIYIYLYININIYSYLDRAPLLLERLAYELARGRRLGVERRGGVIDALQFGRRQGLTFLR